MRRREMILATTAALVGAAPHQPQTFTYKKLAGCEIKLDVFRAPGNAPKPVAVWIHGGALIFGSRQKSPNSPLVRTLLNAGFTLVSIDYRLAPETKLPGIFDDVSDAFQCIRTNAESVGIDPKRAVVCGGSAGGYLTLMTGFALSPRPKALA